MPPTTALAYPRPRPRAYAAAVRPRLWFEPLEPRRVLSVTFDNGILTIRGTDDPEDFLLGLYAGDLVSPGRDGVVNHVEVEQRTVMGNTTAAVGFTNVRGIRLEAGAGNDLVTLEERGDPGIPLTLLGGAGDDTLTGSSADDLLDGQAGNDSVVASGGHDTTPDAPWAPYPDRDPEQVYDRHDRPVGRVHLDPDTGALVVIGTDADEVIEVAVPEGRPSLIGVWINDVLATVPRAAVTSIRVDTAAGNDTAYLYSWGEPISVPVTLIGGAGNDLLYGQWYITGYPRDLERLDPDTVGPLTIFGGDGNDTLYGGAGESHLDAGPGTDHMEPRGAHTTYVDPPDPEPTPTPEPTAKPESPITAPTDNPAPTPASTPTSAPPPFSRDPQGSAPPAALSSDLTTLFASNDPLLSQHREDVWS